MADGWEKIMKLATYNIWDSPSGMPLRFTQIVNEIVNLDADIICLQEVTEEIVLELQKQEETQRI